MGLSLKINENDLNNRNILVLDKKQIEDEYIRVGVGVEGIIYNYYNRYALKIFGEDFYGKGNKRILNRKMKKIESLIEINDPSFCFPIDLVVDSNLNKIGYYMDLLGLRLSDINHLSDLKDEYKITEDKTSIFEILIKTDKAIERIHRKGIIIGDIHGQNIVVDKNNNPRFIDTDNYMYKDFTYDVEPWRPEIYEKHYGLTHNMRDIDIFLYSMEVMEFITGLEPMYQYIDVKEYFDNILNSLVVDKNTIEGLRYIFSDAVNKPYINEVISDIDPNQKIYQKK